MTCIAAIKDGDSIYMGGDSMVSGYITDLIATPKVFQIGEWLLGCAGDSRDCQIIRHAFTPPDVPSGISDDAYMTTIFTVALRTILGNHGRLRKKPTMSKVEL